MEQCAEFCRQGRCFIPFLTCGFHSNRNKGLEYKWSCLLSKEAHRAKYYFTYMRDSFLDGRCASVSDLINIRSSLQTHRAEYGIVWITSTLCTEPTERPLRGSPHKSQLFCSFWFLYVASSLSGSSCAIDWGGRLREGHLLIAHKIKLLRLFPP